MFPYKQKERFKMLYNYLITLEHGDGHFDDEIIQSETKYSTEEFGKLYNEAVSRFVDPDVIQIANYLVENYDFKHIEIHSGVSLRKELEEVNIFEGKIATARYAQPEISDDDINKLEKYYKQ